MNAEVIIVGGGIIGCAAAYNLAKNGVSVLVLEGSENIGNGGSTRNGGGVRQSGRLTVHHVGGVPEVEAQQAHAGDELLRGKADHENGPPQPFLRVRDHQSESGERHDGHRP